MPVWVKSRMQYFCSLHCAVQVADAPLVSHSSPLAMSVMPSPQREVAPATDLQLALHTVQLD